MLASRYALLRPACVRASPVAFRPARVATAAAVRRASPIVCAAEAVDVQAPPPVAERPKEGRCYLPFQRGSQFKVRRVLDVIRGRSYEEALVLLEYMPYKACERIIKVLLSAAANAKNNNNASKSALYVSECYADGGPVYKRIRPRAQGRAGAIQKKTYHLTIKVSERS